MTRGELATMPGTKKKRPYAVISVLLLGFVFLVAFWVTFYTSGDVRVTSDESYLAFEKSFLLADAWLAVCCLFGATGLWIRREYGFLFGLLAASSSLFLGLMDVCFNLNAGIYFLDGWQVWLQVLINIYSLGGGVFVAVVLWVRRTDLLDDRTYRAEA